MALAVARAIPFLEDLVKEKSPAGAFPAASWFEQYRHAKRIPEAVASVRRRGSANAGEKESAISVIESSSP